ncbi:glycosyltransferase [Solirubrobacter deserti]|uniref:Glycosyltransferase n=1 Tax=Solirubrobacter deserti TaxID=2282478 RepID=A0ABT4RQT7_9ACTN|nr:glycosyltransferase [Solirubrobacter deserti]MDA0140934.1 glycosyltransferase [Solirubrobacter deserti]
MDRALASAEEDRPLRIALLAPPWRPVTPTSDGAVEAALASLADALVAAGHDVTLYAAPGSRSLARIVSVLDRAHEREVGSSMVEADHAACAFAAIERAELDGMPFDLVHDHSGWTALAMADRLAVPVVHTVHRPFDEATRDWYRAHGAKAALVCLSRAHAAAGPAGVRVDAVVPNPVEVVSAAKDDFLLWVGRIAPGTGADRAIRVARAAGRPLVLAGAVEREAEAYFSEAIAPHVEGPQVTHVSDLGGARKRELLRRARAILMPTMWVEPFGMTMVEAMAAGTPVIAAPRGSALEVIDDGRTGVFVNDEAELAAALDRVDAIDLDRCRARAEERFGPKAVAQRYAAVYRAIARPLPGAGAPVPAGWRLRSARCSRAASWRRPRPCARH